MSSKKNNDTIYTGRCKWFNNKTGFGFLTVIGGGDGIKDGTDVFAHHSATTVSSEQYRYLVQGEYVHFTVSASSGGKHSVQASNITGINGGQLMCETRNEARIASENNRSDGVGGERARARGEGPRAGHRRPRNDGDERRASTGTENTAWALTGSDGFDAVSGE